MAAATRELAEESGLELTPAKYLGLIEHVFSHPATGEDVNEDWHCWLFDAPPDVAESWSHTPEEEGLTFSYKWLPIDEETTDHVHPHFSEIIELIEQMFGGREADR